MKGLKHLLFGLVFGLVIGWAMGFLRLPYIEKDWSFLLGFIAALALVSLVLLLLAARNKNLLLRLIGKKTVPTPPQSTRTNTFIWIMLVGMLVLGSVMGGITIHRQNQSFKRQIQGQKKQVQELAAMVDSLNNKDLEPLMRSILDDIEAELKHSAGRTLRDTTVARIAALSFAFKPYKYFEADSLSGKMCSPQRGQLLQTLILMGIDTGSFARIKRKTDFSWADLRGVNLKGLDLSGINLKFANLKDADLSGANLEHADLVKANLWGANLNQAKLSHADLKRADLSWAQLNEATLRWANLSGADLTSAQLRKADLNDATMEWAQLGGALFHEANLTSVDLEGTNLIKTNLSQAKLNDTDLRKINMSEAVLVGVNLDKALVDQSWPEKLKQWRPTGVNELQEKFSFVSDTVDFEKRPMFRIKKN